MDFCRFHSTRYSLQMIFKLSVWINLASLRSRLSVKNMSQRGCCNVNFLSIGKTYRNVNFIAKNSLLFHRYVANLASKGSVLLAKKYSSLRLLNRLIFILVLSNNTSTTANTVSLHCKHMIICQTISSQLGLI